MHACVIISKTLQFLADRKDKLLGLPKERTESELYRKATIFGQQERQIGFTGGTDGN